MLFSEAHNIRSPVECDAIRWILGVQVGERAAFQHLYFSYYEQLDRFVSLVMSDAEHVEERIHKIFMMAWYRAAEFRAECTVLTWLLGLSCEVLLNTSDLLPESGVPRAARRCPATQLAVEFAAMPVEHRIVAALVYQLSCSPEEVAQIVRTTIDGVNRRLVSVHDRLRGSTRHSSFLSQHGHPQV
jgi:RNA polymerase sigma-70 factor, ECF subfamily